MTAAQAIKTAANRVSIVNNGPGQYVVHTWSPRHNATWVSNPATRDIALAHAWEAKVRTALELLGVEDADLIAHSEVDRGISRPDWRSVVRENAQ